MIKMMCHSTLLISSNDVIFLKLRLLNFLCTRVYPVTADVFPVIAKIRTKSIQKQIKSIDVDKVGSKKSLASKSCFV